MQPSNSSVESADPQLFRAPAAESEQPGLRMADSAPAEGDQQIGDKRHEWMQNRVTLTLKVKADKFTELLNDEEGGGM